MDLLLCATCVRAEVYLLVLNPTMKKALIKSEREVVVGGGDARKSPRQPAPQLDIFSYLHTYSCADSETQRHRRPALANMLINEPS